MSSPTAAEKANQARFEYEHAVTAARHWRDMAISAAWIEFEKTAAAAWNAYQAVESVRQLKATP